MITNYLPGLGRLPGRVAEDCALEFRVSTENGEGFDLTECIYQSVLESQLPPQNRQLSVYYY